MLLWTVQIGFQSINGMGMKRVMIFIVGFWVVLQVGNRVEYGVKYLA